MLEQGHFTTVTEDVTGPNGSLDYDVIGHVCKFLATSDIKKCRLVSSSWNYQCTPVLRARTRIRIDLSPGYDDDCERLESWDLSYFTDRINLSPVNIDLFIPSSHSYNLTPLDFSAILLFKNLKSFIVHYPAKLEFLWMKELSTNIVSSSSTTLEELEFEWLEDEASLDFGSLGGIVFTKLVKLRVDSNFFTNGPVQPIGQVLFAAFPNVKDLAMNCFYLAQISKEGLLPNFTRSLSSLSVVGEFDATRLECLLKIPTSLKKLEIGPAESSLKIDHRVDELPTILHQILSKHATTLEELFIHVEWLQGGKNLEWKFPAFPILKKLWIMNCDTFTTIVFETGPGSGCFEPINYPKCFPELEILKIFSHTGKSARVETFLPEKMDRQVVESVRQVDVSIYEYRFRVIEEAAVLEEVKIYLRLLSLFPNTRDSVIQNLERVLVYAGGKNLVSRYSGYREILRAPKAAANFFCRQNKREKKREEKKN
ncbi:uncharacterized protein LOC118437375 [Folsomia candida]|uniref:uncharacterized protein LOC118437375 n=1 Tax=Folsomia candida TaxID=158441 RepID=UPI0016050E10|nr:uncharacterized protein LOC118437375 [Folsomia candida]XP_035712223.1 uncharacterized protein LOC118437375 [Folsomia candida]XP_035712224.1 uncharacterized protein LOC118437375 [Folsomia candida]XP_035712225.1 uncharacterized protein LOC118437375 [Folsomia candida]